MITKSLFQIAESKTMAGPDLLNQYKLLEQLTKSLTGQYYKLKDLKSLKSDCQVRFYDDLAIF